MRSGTCCACSWTVHSWVAAPHSCSLSIACGVNPTRPFSCASPHPVSCRFAFCFLDCVVLCCVVLLLVSVVVVFCFVLFLCFVLSHVLCTCPDSSTVFPSIRSTLVLCRAMNFKASHIATMAYPWRGNLPMRLFWLVRGLKDPSNPAKALHITSAHHRVVGVLTAFRMTVSRLPGNGGKFALSPSHSSHHVARFRVHAARQGTLRPCPAPYVLVSYCHSTRRVLCLGA